MNRDSRDHIFAEVGNLRITYVPADDRSNDANWAASDVLRVQAYRGGENSALHKGAEFPVSSSEEMIDLIQTLCNVYRAGQQQS